jgi:serine/threonine protein kinase
VRRGDEFAGRYVLKEVIGAGRSGDVWLAHDKVVGQDVALKPERIEGDRETAVRRLLGEPRAMAKFRDHPHVVTLFDVVTVPEDGEGSGGEEDTYWFIMEYVPGGGLDREPPMSPQRAARIGAQLADALAALHQAGIVHCDIKPANIGLTGRGTAKLLDFGAAHRAGGTETVTANGPSSFTPAYAAPELARGNIPQPASDVFCLGATLYALVTGSPPRGNASDGDDEHGQEEVDGQDTERLTHWKAERGVVEMDAEAVGPLYPVLTSMLQRDPRQRPEATEVKRLLAAIAGSEQDAGERTLEDKPTGSGRRRRPLLAAALGISAALVLGLVLLPDDEGGDTHATDQAGQSRPTDDASNGSGKVSGQSLIGDPHTADLCTLTDTTARGLGRFGEAQVDVDYGNFDRCDVLVHTGGENRIDVSLDLRPGTRPESSQPDRTIGSIGIMEEEPADDECELKLVPERAADGILVGVRVNVGDGTVTGGAATLCAVADSAAQSAADVLNQGPVPRRPENYPKDSLAWSNACDLLDAKALSVVPGIKADAPADIDVAKWGCEWSSDVDDLETEVSFFRDQPKTAADGDSIRLSGYDAIVEAEDDTCSVFVEYREYSGENAETAAEMLRLRVDGGRPTAELRSMATALARSAAAKLPRR